MLLVELVPALLTAEAIGLLEERLHPGKTGSERGGELIGIQAECPVAVE
jgi:hypothetical protein